MSNPSAALDRFLRAQAADYGIALSELRRGRKQGHWIWYILPQLRGLGMGARSVFDTLGEIDALKFRSCLMLFATIDQEDQLFQRALTQFFGGLPDTRTLQLLAVQHDES